MRRARPLIFASELPPMNRIEVLIAEAQLEHGEYCNPPDLSTERLLTLCVSFDPTPAVRRSARSMAATFVTAACSFEQPSEGSPNGIGALRLLMNHSAAAVSLVVALPDEYDLEVERQVDNFLDYLRTRSGHNLQLAVAVTVSPAKWAACAFDGFVLSSHINGVGDGLAMFNMLASLMAPDYLCPFDAGDILGCIGSALEPSSLHSLTFFPDTSEAIPDSARADRSLRGCAAVAFAPVAHSIRLSELHGIFKALRSVALPDCHVIQVASTGLVAQRPGTDAIPVQLLTRPTLS